MFNSILKNAEQINKSDMSFLALKNDKYKI